MQIWTTEEVGNHAHRNTGGETQFEVKITSLHSESLNLRHGDVSRVEMSNIRKMGLELREECKF